MNQAREANNPQKFQSWRGKTRSLASIEEKKPEVAPKRISKC
jgi:hypothetical protein